VSARRLQGPLAAFAVAAAAVFVGKALAPEAAVFRETLTEPWLYRLGGATKLLFLALAWHHAQRTARTLGAENPARGAWRMFAFGLLCFALAQGFLSAYQIATGQSLFPSPADILFMAAYPSLILAFWRFVRAYRETGYPVGSAAQHAGIAAIVALVFLVVGHYTLRPALTVDAPILERLLNTAYPVLDGVMLVPILILTRITWPFRGGAVFQAWATLLVGFTALCAGDVIYAWFSILDMAQLDPIVDATYVVAYFGVARGTLLHRELLAG
jgi:hypothetical protein